MGRERVIDDKIYSVSEINLIIKTQLEYSFYNIKISGEISNFTKYSSGHLYFDIKDDKSKIKCVMFKSYALKLKEEIKEGDHIIVKGRITLYEVRGDIQVIVEKIEKSGKGELFKRFEELKEKLRKEGLFDEKYKKKLPFFPRKIGVVTSRDGAAIMDILRVISRRFAGLHIILYPAIVQGEESAKTIVRGIENLNKIGGVDVIIIGRGGGSIEDLWGFNEEIVARAIFKSEIPIISAVGHEVDFTISDFTADVRAATPSAAAELVVNKRVEIEEKINSFTNKMEKNIKFSIEKYKNILNNYSSNRVFSDYKFNLERKNYIIDETINRMKNVFKTLINHDKKKLWEISVKIHKLHPLRRLEREKGMVSELKNRLNNKMINLIKDYNERISGFSDNIKKRSMNNLEVFKAELENLDKRLNSLSHKKVLERGYSIVLKGKDIIKSVDDINRGDRLDIMLYKGKLIVNTIDKEREKNE
jgi:exodeoxyribonuclease VII large subunit